MSLVNYAGGPKPSSIWLKYLISTSQPNCLPKAQTLRMETLKPQLQLTIKKSKNRKINMLLRVIAGHASRFRQSQWQLTNCRNMASKTPKAKGGSTKGKKTQPKFDKKTQTKSDLKDKKPEEVLVASPDSIAKQDAELRRRLLAEDEKNPALDVGPNGRSLFTSAPSLSSLTDNDVNHYFRFR